MKGYDIADDYIIKVLHMSIDFSKLLKSTKSDDIEPRDIFMALPGKDKKYEYPRDVQSDVWKKWFPRPTPALPGNCACRQRKLPRPAPDRRHKTARRQAEKRTAEQLVCSF